jgi:putative hydrolase of the HAD superfamily
MPVKNYKHIFFDLDRTLWDFDKNANETFLEIHNKYALESLGVTDFPDFYNVFHEINLGLWDDYRKGLIVKEVLSVKRFALTLSSFGIEDDSLSINMAADYINISPTKKHLYAGTIELLDYLLHKYPLHIITNGFEEVQHKKLEHSGLNKYFTHVITSEDAGYKKPDINIFRYACAIAGANEADSIMIGDDVEVDIIGAAAAGIDQLLVDFEHKYPESGATYTVNGLEEIIGIL